MSSNSKSINALSAQHKRIQTKRAALLEKAYELSKALNEEFGNSEIYASSLDTMLDYAGPGEGSYGRLVYDGEEIKMIYRTTDEDLEDNANSVPKTERSYRGRPLSGCPQEWLDRLLTAELISSLIANLGAVLNGREKQVDQSLGAIDKLLAAESADIEAQMEVVLGDQKSDVLTQNWSAVQDATHLDTADALTRSSRTLEAVCTFILNARGIALPADKSMAPLLKACMNALEWPEAKDAENDVNQLRGGVQSICNAVGSLRTHFGTAHGASSHLPPLDPQFAILAKNACATMAIFLLSRHKLVSSTFS